MGNMVTEKEGYLKEWIGIYQEAKGEGKSRAPLSRTKGDKRSNPKGREMRRTKKRARQNIKHGLGMKGKQETHERCEAVFCILSPLARPTCESLAYLSVAEPLELVGAYRFEIDPFRSRPALDPGQHGSRPRVLPESWPIVGAYMLETWSI